MAFNNIGEMMKLMGAWNTFKSNHPKFPAFLSAVSRQGMQEGTVIEAVITDPEGKKIETSIKLTQSDLDLFNELKNMSLNR